MATAPDRKTLLDARRTKMLQGQINTWLKDPKYMYLALPDAADINRWHILIVGLDDPFAGGEYIFSFVADEGFPQEPPKALRCHTPNGVFLGAPSGAMNICISIGEFHSNAYRPALGLAGFGEQVCAALVTYETLGGGLGIAEPKPMPAAIRKAAAASHEFNLKHHGKLMEEFALLAAKHPQRVASKSAIALWRKLESPLLEKLPELAAVAAECAPPPAAPAAR